MYSSPVDERGYFNVIEYPYCWLKNILFAHTLSSSTCKANTSSPQYAFKLSNQVLFVMQQSTPTKKKWFSRRINQFNTWHLVELQKWLKTAKRILNNGNLKRKKTLKTIVSTTKVSRYVHQLLPATDT